MQYAAQAYFQTQVGTTGQGELVVLLFDGALRFLAQAREKMLLKDMAAKGNLISKAMDVVHELDGSLNMEVGGDVAQNLRQLYFLCTTRMMMANLKLDVELLDSVVNILSGLRSAFAQILTQPEAQAAAASIAQRQSPAMSARPLSAPAAPVAPATRGMAAHVYSQQSARVENGPRVFQAPAVQPPAPPRTTPLTPPLLATAMARPLVTPPVQAPAQPAPRPAPAPQAAVQPVAPAAPAAPLVPETPRPSLLGQLSQNEGGFAGKRLAAYSKQLA